MKETQKTPENNLLTRALPFRQEAIVDAETRTIRVSFSSETEYLRQPFFSEPWVEILGHEEKEVDFSRLNSGAPVLYNHHRSDANYKVIGVVERAWLEKGRGIAELRLSRRADIDAIWQDVQDGILRNVSVAYSIDERTLTEEKKDAPSIYRVTRWTPMEISLVDIPADPTVGVGRSANLIQPNLKEEPMTKETIKETRVDTPPDLEQARSEARKEALASEQTRRDAIREAFKPFGEEQRGLLDKCLDDQNMSAAQAQDLLLKELGRGKQPLAIQSNITVGEGEHEKFARYAEDAIAVRAGLTKPTEGSNEMRGYTLFELARRSLEIHGVRTGRMDKLEIVGRAFTHSSSDFPKLLSNNAHKAMLKGYTEAPEVFEQFTSIGNLSDFKAHDRLGLSEFGSLDVVPEGGEYKRGTFKEQREQIQLATYGKMFSITRQAIINDDLRAFTDIPRKMGRAARRKVGDLVFGILNSNPNMADGVALFHANHKNLAGSAAAPTVASVGSARTAMQKQKDASSNAVLNIRPSYIIAPVALEDTLNVLMTSETDPTSGQANSRKPNPIRGAAQVIVDARLDEASATAWYLAADSSAFDTIEVGYLDGNPNPFLEQQNGWDVDGVEYKVRIDAAAKALEFRTLYKNAGA